jgi:uncharacterized protein (TIGR03083 family)
MTPAPKEPSLDDVLSALQSSHDRLVAAVAPLTGDQITAPSYDDDWTLAQVCSHLGSQADIFELFIDAGLRQSAAPGIEQFQAVWDTWNAKSADEQARDAVTAERALLERVQGVPTDERTRWRLDMFGAEQSLIGLMRMRLAEHCLHTWDVKVASDDSATLTDTATELIIDNLPALVERVGKGVSTPVVIQVSTTAPERTFRLELTTESAELSPGDPEASGTNATLRLPGESLVRLVYGRLDPDHTPTSVETSEVDLPTLRAAFPGV